MIKKKVSNGAKNNWALHSRTRPGLVLGLWPDFVRFRSFVILLFKIIP